MNKKQDVLLGFPNPPATTITLSTSHRSQDICFSCQSQQSQESKDQSLLVVDDLLFGDDHLMFGAGLQALNEEFVPRTASGAEYLAFRQETDGQGDLQGDVLHKGGQHVGHGKTLQEALLVCLEELSPQRLGWKLPIERMLVQLLQQRNVDFTTAGQLAVAVVVEAVHVSEIVQGLVGDA